MRTLIFSVLGLIALVAVIGRPPFRDDGTLRLALVDHFDISNEI